MRAVLIEDLDEMRGLEVGVGETNGEVTDWVEDVWALCVAHRLGL